VTDIVFCLQVTEFC